jgi:hypothetical protein
MGSDTTVAKTGWRIDNVSVATQICGGTAPAVNSAVSRKTHAAAGIFDVNLPLNVPFTGAIGIEPRTGAVAGAHQMVVTFANPVSVGGVAVTSGTGTAAFTVAGAAVTIDLTGVTDVQRLGVTLSNVTSGANIGNVLVPMGVLAGDVGGNASVTGSDVSQAKAAASSGVVNGSSFRSDVNSNGTINATDVSIVKSKSGTTLP